MVVIVHCFGSTLVLYIDLEIWTLLVESVVSISLLTSDFLRFGIAIIDSYNLLGRVALDFRLNVENYTTEHTWATVLGELVVDEHFGWPHFAVCFCCCLL